MGDSRRIAKPGIRSEGGELSRKVEKVLFQEDDDGRWCEEIENSDWQKIWILKKEFSQRKKKNSYVCTLILKVFLFKKNQKKAL